MRVKLIAGTQDPIDVMYTAARTCYSAKGPIEIHDTSCQKDIEDICKLVKQVLDSGHQSIAEHVSFKFAIEGISRACYDKETEVLTNHGWKLFKDLLDDDFVATLNINGNLEFQKPIDYIQYDYNGKLHKYLSKGVDLQVTPNHNMWFKYYERKNKDYHLEPSENIITAGKLVFDKHISWNVPTEDKIFIDGYTYLRRVKNNKYYDKEIKGQHFDKINFTKLLAIYLSEGSTYYDEIENKYCITISQNKYSKLYGTEINTETRKEIQEVIEALGFTCTVCDTGIKFNSPLLGPLFKSLGTGISKEFPFDVFSYFNQDLAKLFIDTYIKYDGNTYKGHKTIYSSSKSLIDSIQLIAGIAGYATRIVLNKPKGTTHIYHGQEIKSNADCWALSLSNSKNTYPYIRRDKHFSVVDYNDKVYCVEVPNHIILVRRNNVMIWCGNCSHQLVRHRAGIVFSQQSQRYVEIKESVKEIGEYLEGMFYKPGDDVRKCEEYENKLMQICDKYFVDVCEDNISEYAHTLYWYLKKVSQGIKPEDARNFLPNATKTNIVMTVNFRELIHICNLRLCTRAQKEIRELFKLIVDELSEHYGNVIVDYLVPQCEVNGFCTEAKCCGRKPSIKEMKAVYEIFKQDTISKEDYEQLMDSIKNPKVNKKLKQLLEMESVLEE